MFNLILQAAPSGSGTSSYSTLIFMVLIFVVFYFFMIRPQSKKAKQATTFREGIKKGDKIVTIGGMHGTVAEVGDTTFVIEVENGVRMRFEKSSVSMEATQAATEKKDVKK
jgi:preprotein translocase subunit YajC